MWALEGLLAWELEGGKGCGGGPWGTDCAGGRALSLCGGGVFLAMLGRAGRGGGVVQFTGKLQGAAEVLPGAGGGGGCDCFPLAAPAPPDSHSGFQSCWGGVLAVLGPPHTSPFPPR